VPAAHHFTLQKSEMLLVMQTEYIEMFYNRQRRQAALGYLSPAAFARKGQEELPPKAA